MTYIGAEPDAAFTTTAKQTITGTGVATYTLDHAVSSESDIRVYVDNVHQEGGTGKAYTVDGNQITFTENITSSMDCYVIFSAMALQTTAPAADSISTGMIKDGAVTSAKLDGLTSSDMPSGSVLQIQYTQVTATSQTSNFTSAYSTVDVTPINVSITPTSTSSKVKIEVSMMGEFDGLAGPHNTMFWLKRTIGSTTTNLRAPADETNNALGIAPATITYNQNQNSTPEHLSFLYFDEPNTTSAVTYQLAMTNGSTTGYAFRVNKNGQSGGGDYERGISCISATEIAG